MAAKTYSDTNVNGELGGLPDRKKVIMLAFQLFTLVLALVFGLWLGNKAYPYFDKYCNELAEKITRRK